MPNISILSASVRKGRASHRVALFFQQFIQENSLGDTRMLDLNIYKFPIFEERLKYLQNPSQEIIAFSNAIQSSDAVIIVTPEYNGGYPASLKNVIDLLYQDWFRKPIGIVTVSDGTFGGSQVITSLLFTLWKMKAWVVPSMFPVPQVLEHYNEQGQPMDKAVVEKRAKKFVDDIIWCIEARKKMEN